MLFGFLRATPNARTNTVAMSSPFGALEQPKQLTAELEQQTQEQALIELCLAGQKDAFRKLVDRYQGRVMAVSMRLVGRYHEAEELAQQSFVDAFSCLPDFDPRYRFAPWLLRITVNNCKDYLKSKKRTEVSLDEAPDENSSVFCGSLPHPETSLLQAESARHIHQALGKVPIKYREVLVLKDLEDLSYEEIRTILRLPITTLKIRVVRARKMLKEYLGDDR